MLSCNRVTIMLSYSHTHTFYNRSKKPQECNMVIIAKATDSEPASVVCDMNSPSSKWLTTLRVNFSKEVRRPCSVSAGCCCGRGGKQGECLGQVRVLTRVGSDVVSEEKRGPSIAKMGAEDNARRGCIFRKWSGVSDKPAEGAMSKWERVERLAWTEAAVICLKSSILHRNECLFSCAHIKNDIHELSIWIITLIIYLSEVNICYIDIHCFRLHLYTSYPCIAWCLVCVVFSVTVIPVFFHSSLSVCGIWCHIRLTVSLTF